MFSTALIVFREVLEAALIVGILAAATRGIAGRGRWLLGGVALGVLGSALVAAGTEVIANLASGIGQELFNASVLSLAVVMLATHNIWMTTHGRALAADAQGIGSAVRLGEKKLTAMLIVVAIAVLREGAETVLFLYGISASAGTGAMLAGGLTGLLGGVACGYFLYTGLVRIPLKLFFKATSLLILLLAASMAAQAVGLLIQAGVIADSGVALWDTSAFLREDSLPGMLAHGLTGYTARPAAAQVFAYFTTLVCIIAAMTFAHRLRRRHRHRPALSAHQVRLSH